MRDEYIAFEEAINRANEAKACISQNRGYDRELAREGYHSVISEELVPAYQKAIDFAMEDLEPGEIHRLANKLLILLKILGLI